MSEYLSFEEVAAELKCSKNKVRQLVIEDKSIRATRITPNGLVLTECGLDGHFPYDLDFNCHLDDEGSITTDIYGFGAHGGTEKKETLFVGYLRIERDHLKAFLLLNPSFATQVIEPARTHPVSTVEAVMPAPAPVSLAALVKPNDANPHFSMTKAAMLTHHKHEWPTLERDITDASTNGLDAAKAGPRGWYETDAMAWARANNKLVNTSKPTSSLEHGLHKMVSLPGRKHTLEG